MKFPIELLILLAHGLLCFYLFFNINTTSIINFIFRFPMALILIYNKFGKIDVVLSFWIVNNILTISMYYCFLFWEKIRQKGLYYILFFWYYYIFYLRINAKLIALRRFQVIVCRQYITSDKIKDKPESVFNWHVTWHLCS